MTAEAYRTRAVAWNAFYELDFSTDRRDLTGLARHALEAAFSIRKPDTEKGMTEQSYQTRKALAAFIGPPETDVRVPRSVPTPKNC